MSRSYRRVRPKHNRVYTVEEILKLYDICRNTLSNWINAGLRPIDAQRPQLFCGAELIRFHDERALATKQPLREREFICLRCKARVTPNVDTVQIDRHVWRCPRATARCPECGGMIGRLLDAPTCTAYLRCIESNTSLYTLDEENGATPARIGTNAPIASPGWNADNERIIRILQDYGGRYADKTLDAHLAAIRDCEAFYHCKSLRKATPADAARYRDHLVQRGIDGLSRSTIRHYASFLRQFFNWLVAQDGYRRMNRTIANNFQLSKQQAAMAIQPEPRDVPTLDQILQMLDSMQTTTRISRRDRAIIAATLLFGTRASATASLLLHHIDIERRTVRQDATVVRVKNSKSQTTRWFPVDEMFAKIIVSWIEELRASGFNNDDPLFPRDEAFEHVRPGNMHSPITPWATADGIRRAFKRGSESAGVPYFNPHSKRHFIAALADIYCRTPEEEQAWSYNLGHSDVRVMKSNYNKMTDQRRDAAFARISARDPLEEEDKDLLLCLYEHQLTPGSPEHDKAFALSQMRMQRSKDGG